MKIHLPTGLLALALTACVTSAGYQKAKKTDTPDAYRAFLASQPKDEDEAGAARERLSELEFDRAKEAHTVAAYKRFLEQFPDSSKADAARERLEALRFAQAEAQDSAEGWRDFLRMEPSGKHAAEAHAALEKAQARELAKSGQLDQLARWMKRSDDPALPKVESQLDDARFAQAKATGAAALLAYLKDFPTGAHRTEAETQLVSLKLDGLFFSGAIEEARTLATHNPLAAKLPDLNERLARAEAERRLVADPAPPVENALAEHYLRPVADLAKAARAPDPLDRWEALEELGQHPSVKAIDPLLAGLRSGRNPKVRERAYESLAQVFASLPRPIAEYQLATRLAALRAEAASPEIRISLSALEQIAGELGKAENDYQRAAAGSAVDPVLLRRIVELREEKGESFSAAVAARQISVWAQAQAKEATVAGQGGIPLAASRDLCAARDFARFAQAAISRAAAKKTDFPKDLAQFQALAEQAVKATGARLADAEILLRTQDPHARTCDDRRVADRLAEAEKLRAQAIAGLAHLKRPAARAALERAAEKDPSPDIRALARRTLAAVR